MAGLIIERRSGSIVDNKRVTAPATTGEATDVPLFLGIFIKFLIKAFLQKIVEEKIYEVCKIQ